MNDLMKKYLLYNLRSLTVGTGLNALIVGILMSNGYSYLQSVPVGAFTAINISFFADRMIFGQKKKENKLFIIFCHPILAGGTNIFWEDIINHLTFSEHCCLPYLRFDNHVINKLPLCLALGSQGQ